MNTSQTSLSLSLINCCKVGKYSLSDEQLRHRDIKGFCQGYTHILWQSSGVNPGFLWAKLGLSHCCSADRRKQEYLCLDGG